MRKMTFTIFIISLALINYNNAQNKLSEENVKASLTKIFDMSKNQNFSGISSILLFNQGKEMRTYNYGNSSEAKSVKRIAKKIKAFLDLSDSYEYKSITKGSYLDKQSTNLEVIFNSGDQKLTISFLFIEHDGKILLADFK